MKSSFPHSIAHNAVVELRHIKLELDSGRRQHLRHFIDQYYCYCAGGAFVTSTGRANWGKIWDIAAYSREARALYGDRKNLVKEHVVPLRVIGEILTSQNLRAELSLEAIGGILRHLTHFAIITKREDHRLRAAGLTSKMPSAPLPTFPFFPDIYARYRIAGIEVNETF